MEIKDKSQRRKPREVEEHPRFATIEELGRYKSEKLMKYIEDVGPEFLKRLHNGNH